MNLTLLFLFNLVVKVVVAMVFFMKVMSTELVEVMGNSKDIDRCLSIIHGGVVEKARAKEQQ